MEGWTGWWKSLFLGWKLWTAAAAVGASFLVLSRRKIQMIKKPDQPKKAIKGNPSSSSESSGKSTNHRPLTKRSKAGPRIRAEDCKVPLSYTESCTSVELFELMTSEKDEASMINI